MPNTTSLYEPRSMTQALLESFPARRFLTSTFFGEVVHDTPAFQIDIFKGSRRLSPFVHPKMAGKVVDREKFRTFEFRPPYLKPKRETNVDHILARQPGETVYVGPGGNSPAERAAVQLGKDMAELDEMNLRRIEAMAAEALTLGQVTVKGDGVDTVVNFDFDATHTPTLTGADLWTASTSDPLGDFTDWVSLIGKDSGLTATDAILGAGAAAALLNNVNFKSQLDIRNLEIGAINPRDLGEGVRYLGRITAIGLDLWTYDEWYVNDAGNTVPMIPTNRVVVLSRNMRADVHYGVIQDLDAGNFAARAFVKSWTEEDPSARFLLVQSAPLPVPHQINAIVTAVVI